MGESIGHSGLMISQLCNNLRSALYHNDIISKEIDSLWLEGCIHRPFSEPPLPHFHCSPLGSLSCKCNPKQHIFNHYSWPEFGLVNSQTPDMEGSIHYNSFTSMVAVLKESGKGSLLTKLNLRDTYRHIPVCSMDWNLLGFHWRENFYYHHSNVQGEVGPLHIKSICRSPSLDNPETHPGKAVALPQQFSAHIQSFSNNT